ncbi:MAG: hypothetical protein ACSW8J_03975, partial [bacterium]
MAMYDRRPDYFRETQVRRPVRRDDRPTVPRRPTATRRPTAPSRPTAPRRPTAGRRPTAMGRPTAALRSPRSRAYARKLAMQRRRRRFVAACVLVALVLAAILMIGGLRWRAPAKVIVEEPQAYIAAPPLSDDVANLLLEEPAEEPTEIPTETPIETLFDEELFDEAPVEEPTVTPTEMFAEASAPAKMALVPAPLQENMPNNSAWKLKYGIYTDGDPVKNYIRDGQTAFPEDGSYSAIEGVTTFRGGNLRQNAAYGTAALKENRFKVLWKNSIGAIDSGYAEWTGVGWTGQPAMVRWPASLRAVMNLKPEYKGKENLIEVIYATLDGNIYFLDGDTGEYTREPIHLGFPIK